MDKEKFTAIFVDVDLPPIKLRDGAVGVIIRGCDAEGRIGVQVFGEEDIRWIALGEVSHLGGGAFEQK